MPLERERVDPCPACDGTRFRAVYPTIETSGSVNAVVRCRGCGLVVAARMPSERQLHDHYAEYSYWSEEAWRVTPATEVSLTRLAARLERFRGTGRLLDVGCGAGVVMRAMTGKAWAAEGTELSELAAERLREWGYTVHLGALEELDLPGGAFDVVVLSEIVEHLPEPRLTLAAAHRLLRPGGAVYMTTPNFDALSRRALGVRWRVISLPEHLCYFNRASLGRLLRRVGLSPLTLATEGINPYEILGSLRASGRGGACGSKGENLRELSAGSGPLALVKKSVNAALRATNLGDTLKALATRPLKGV